MALSKRLLLLALGDAGQLPPLAFEAWSVEYFLATAFQRLAAVERGLRPASAFASVFVRTMRRSRVLGLRELRLVLVVVRLRSAASVTFVLALGHLRRVIFCSMQLRCAAR